MNCFSMHVSTLQSNGFEQYHIQLKLRDNETHPSTKNSKAFTFTHSVILQ